MITVVTPTGDRPEAFSLSRKWMFNQTVKPKLWIIVDDGKTPMSIDDPQPYEYYIRRNPTDSDPKHTLVVNIQYAFSHLIGDKILFWEDDEYYAPSYIETMTNKLDVVPFIGIGCAKYYHLPTGGYEQHKNINHASLAQTAFHISQKSLVDKCISKGMQQRWLDDNIWRTVKKLNIPHEIFVDYMDSLYCGIKGLPGRFGIGIGHNPKAYKKIDAKRTKIKEWVPNDYQCYLDMIGGTI